MEKLHQKWYKNTVQGMKHGYAQSKKAWVMLRDKMNWLVPIIKWIGEKLSFLNPRNYIQILDWYIIKKFIGTYFYSIILIISISIVIDVNENLAKFTEYHAPLKAIVFDYYLNFVPYFANLFSPLSKVCSS